MSNPAEGGTVGAEANDEGEPSDGDRPFPFDRGTQRVYDAPFWDTRTGVGQIGQVLFLKDEDLMVQFAFYGDGSGEHGKGTFVVAGYMAGTIDWFHIESLWCAELQSPPKINYFKAYECLHLTGEFKGWTPDAASAKRDRLADIVRRNGEYLHELSSTIRWDDFHSVMGDGITKQAFYHPYCFCFHGAISAAINRAKELKDHTGRIAFVFDTESNGSLDIDMEQQYKHARDTLPKAIRDRMGFVGWDTDLKAPTLQIADLIAWSIRAEKEGLGSPVIKTLRERISKAITHEWNPSGLLQWVVDTDKKFGT